MVPPAPPVAALVALASAEAASPAADASDDAGGRMTSDGSMKPSDALESAEPPSAVLSLSPLAVFVPTAQLIDRLRPVFVALIWLMSAMTSLVCVTSPEPSAVVGAGAGGGGAGSALATPARPMVRPAAAMAARPVRVRRLCIECSPRWLVLMFTQGVSGAVPSLPDPTIHLLRSGNVAHATKRDANSETGS